MALLAGVVAPGDVEDRRTRSHARSGARKPAPDVLRQQRCQRHDSAGANLATPRRRDDSGIQRRRRARTALHHRTGVVYAVGHGFVLSGWRRALRGAVHPARVARAHPLVVGSSGWCGGQSGRSGVSQRKDRPVSGRSTMKAMRTRVLAVIGCLSLAAAALALTHAPLDAQAQNPAAPARAAAAAKPAVPRLADGHPDFQGFYDVSTMTPVDRPRGVKNLVLTEQEAVAMERYEAQRQAKNDAPLASDRSAPPVGGESTAPKTYLEFLEAAGGGVVGGYNNFWLAGGDHVIRVDGQPRSSLIIDPPDGQVPPMKPEAQKRNAAFLAGAVAPDAGETGGASPPGAFDGPESRPLAERCLLGFLNTSGPPTLPNYFYNNMKQ